MHQGQPSNYCEALLCRSSWRERATRFSSAFTAKKSRPCICRPLICSPTLIGTPLPWGIQLSGRKPKTQADTANDEAPSDRKPKTKADTASPARQGTAVRPAAGAVPAGRRATPSWRASDYAASGREWTAIGTVQGTRSHAASDNGSSAKRSGSIGVDISVRIILDVPIRYSTVVVVPSARSAESSSGKLLRQVPTRASSEGGSAPRSRR